MTKRLVRACWPIGLLIALAAVSPAAAQVQARKTHLRNRVVVITKEVRTSDVLAICVFLRGGASLDPAERPGLANFTQRMLLRGTLRRTAEQIMGPIEGIGGSLQARADYDYLQMHVLSGTRALDMDLEILADVLRNPRFDPAEIEKERAQILAELAGLDENPTWHIQRTMAQLLYESGPYAQPVPGTAASVKAITREDLVRFHRQHYVGENLLVVVVGNVDRGMVEGKVARALGDIPFTTGEPAKPRPAVMRPISERGANVAVRERGSELAHLAIGFPVGAINREEYPGLMVMSSLIGGGMGSRLMREVRERQGLGYDLGCYYTQFAGPGYLTAQIKTDPVRVVFGLDGPYATNEPVINKSKDALLEQFEWVRQQPASEMEVERARRYTIGSFLYDHQRTLNQARYLGWFELIGLGYQYDAEFPRAVEKITRDDLMKLAAKYFNRYAVALVMPEPQQRP